MLQEKDILSLVCIVPMQNALTSLDTQLKGEDTNYIENYQQIRLEEAQKMYITQSKIFNNDENKNQLKSLQIAHDFDRMMQQRSIPMDVQQKFYAEILNTTTIEMIKAYQEVIMKLRQHFFKIQIDEVRQNTVFVGEEFFLNIALSNPTKFIVQVSNLQPLTKNNSIQFVEFDTFEMQPLSSYCLVQKTQLIKQVDNDEIYGFSVTILNQQMDVMLQTPLQLVSKQIAPLKMSLSFKQVPHPGVMQLSQELTTHYDGEIVKCTLQIQCADEAEVYLNFNDLGALMIPDLKPLPFCSDSVADQQFTDHVFKIKVKGTVKFDAYLYCTTEFQEETKQILIVSKYKIGTQERRIVYQHKYSVTKILDAKIAAADVSETSTLAASLRQQTMEKIAAQMHKVQLTSEQIKTLRKIRHKLTKLSFVYVGHMTKNDTVDIVLYSKMLGESKLYREGVYYSIESFCDSTEWTAQDFESKPEFRLIANQKFIQQKRKTLNKTYHTELMEYMESSQSSTNIQDEEDHSIIETQPDFEICQQCYCVVAVHGIELLFCYDL
ncbi:Conserved_hypothetical protein [Hexamita inflata]|uniref:Uncharacterized protein n=1 Tax=Hexamita inflata TaxID=28002 RepID=A0AA86UQI2_9EUKA|nr:Conserved hypothetical protein [Hexamita inflata]